MPDVPWLANAVRDHTFGDYTLKRLLVLSAFLFSAALVSADSGAYYIGQVATGTGDGSSCANGLAVTFFNTSSNWGSGTGEIGPGATVNLCGTITTQMTVQGSGSSGSPITIQWQSGTSLSVCSTTAALVIENLSYLIIDLGGNSTAITCPNNGTGLGSTVAAVGIGYAGYTYGFSNVEIRNGTIGPLYQYTCCSNDGLGSYGISLYGGSNDYFHNLVLNNVSRGISFAQGRLASTSRNVISNNTCSGTNGIGSVGSCIWYTNASPAAYTDTGALIHDNSIVLGEGWSSAPSCYVHIVGIDTFQQGSSGAQDNIANLAIYNNYFYSSQVGCTSGYIELTTASATCAATSTLSAQIFNNVMVQSGTWNGGDGFLYEHGCQHTTQIYNNTFDNGNNASGICMEIDGNPNSITLINNICMNVRENILNATGTPTLTANNNVYYNVGALGWYWNGKYYSTLATWQKVAGQDANSSVGNPGLDSNYKIISTASLAYKFGANLTGFGIAQLDTTAPVSFGVSGICGLGCTSRPSSGPWDAGAFQYMASGQPSPPTGLTAAVQ